MTGEEQAARTAPQVKDWPPAAGWFVLYSKDGMVGWMSAYRAGENVRVVSFCPRRNLTTQVEFDDAGHALARFEEAKQITVGNGHTVMYDGLPLLDTPDLLS